LGTLPGANTAIDTVYRSDWGGIFATLIPLFGDFNVAEVASQETFTVGVDQWLSSGVPDFRRAWIMLTAATGGSFLWTNVWIESR
jgi:RNA polymerase sigma-70 factor, ECF subfamily